MTIKMIKEIKTMDRKGIDVSRWQGDIDFKKVKESGIDFVIIREGYGKKDPKQIDKKFKENYQKAKEVGLNVGVYHYSYADSIEDAKLEAQFCLENIQGMQFEYPIVIDLEDKEQLKLNNRQRTDIVKAFCEEIEKAKYYAMFYCNLNWLNNYLIKDELLPKYDLWLAQWYVKGPAINCGIWQYSSEGKIDGINGNVDLDISYKDYPNAMKYNGLNGFKREKPTTYTNYTVKKGDSLWSIAQKELGDGTKWEQIKRINNLDTTVIYPNQILKIPR